MQTIQRDIHPLSMGVWRDLSVLAGSVQGGDAHPQPIALSAGTCTWSFGDTHRENVQFLIDAGQEEY